MVLNPVALLAAVVMSACCLVSEVTLASTPTTTSVSLTAVANVEAIAPNGTAVSHGGLDTYGNAYSSSLLGSSLTWSGIPFTLGAAGALDAVSSQTIPLPAGQYSTLNLLATGVDGEQPDQSFIVTYSDGTTSTITQSLSDWWSPYNYAGESRVGTYSYKVTATGGIADSKYYLYGYSFAINSSKTVHSLTLPNNRHVIVMAVSVTSPTETIANIAAAAKVDAIANNGSAPLNGGLDGYGNAYSSALLGSTVTWAGVTFNLGAAGTFDAASGSTLALPAGRFSQLYLLATGVDGEQPNQNFVVTYSDGTTSTITQSLSDWWSPKDYAGESRVGTYPYKVTETGGIADSKYYLYGYSFTIDGTKTTASITLPNNRHVIVLAISLTSSSSTTTATAPAVPANLTARAGNAQVALSWTASSGATGYHLKRATTSGGPYTQIAAPTSTSYSDTSLTNGTTYYYAVSAFDSAGESANSAQISAEPTVPASPASAPAPAPTTFGTWINVTPANANLTDVLDCGNYGTQSAQADPAHPSNVYTLFMCQGIWKSTDYGATWTGPINTGSNGATVGDCAGGITISPTSTASVPTIYAACIRGNGTGFWKSVDGGVNWTTYSVGPTAAAGRQDYYPPVVDPYDQNHLLMAGHEMDYLVESVDGGQTWSSISLANGMLENGGTGAIFFVNTGNASSTRGTFLWMGQASGGAYGTWRTANDGGLWTQVDLSEHSHGASQMYQPDNNGVVYIAGVYSVLGWGVLRSTDYGQTWAHVGGTSGETVVVGTSKNVYSMTGGPIGIGGVANPNFELAAQPGTGTWAMPATPAGLTQGSAQFAVVNDGTHNIIVGAMWNSGMWRYIEP